jgi:hypothetical protein
MFTAFHGFHLNSICDLLLIFKMEVIRIYQDWHGDC